MVPTFSFINRKQEKIDLSRKLNEMEISIQFQPTNQKSPLSKGYAVLIRKNEMCVKLYNPGRWL